MQIITTMKYYYTPTRMVKILEKDGITKYEHLECSYSKGTVNPYNQLGKLFGGIN